MICSGNSFELRNDDNLRFLDNTPEIVINLGDNLVVPRLPSKGDIRKAWVLFNETFNEQLVQLYCTSYEEIVEKYGLLGFGVSMAESRGNLPYGMLFTGAPAKFAHISKKATREALFEMGVPEARNSRGGPRSKIPGGSIEELALSLPEARRAEFIRTAVAVNPDFDSHMKFLQTSRAGWSELNDQVLGASDPETLLSQIAKQTEHFFTEQKAKGTKESYAKTSGKVFAPAWFAQFLAREGIWLFPVSYLGKLRQLYPQRLLPLLARMSVPAAHLGAADRILSLQKAASGDTRQFALNVFSMTALGTNMWHRDGFRPEGLVMFKEWAQQEGSEKQSAAASLVYRALAGYFDEDFKQRPEAHLFFARKRYADRGVEPFSWCFDPRSRNTKGAERCLGRPVEKVPEFVRDWAREFRRLLPLFQVKHVGLVENRLNTWLYYLLTLPEHEAPMSLFEIDRIRHVHDLGGKRKTTFYDFLAANFTEDAQTTGRAAISAMAKAWRLAAARDGLADLACPFDVTLDQAVPSAGSLGKTPKKALLSKVWEILVRENRAGFYAFARDIPRGIHWRTCLDPATGSFEHVFWPAQPMVVDIILTAGPRLHSARWVDSGEGDEFRVNLDRRVEARNNLPSAIPGRREGFLRLFDIVGKTRETVVGMYFSVNKTGNSYDVPWVDPEVAEAAAQMEALQARYNPISAPIRARDPQTGDQYSNPELFPLVFPLFREPDDPLGIAVSENKVRRYWTALLEHCQPIVNNALGYEYALVREGEPLFSIHSLRVTTVTMLIEKGVSLEIVQRMVGHVTPAMTWYYNATRDERVARQLREAYESRSGSLDDLADGDEGVVLAVAAEAAAMDAGGRGAEMLREMAGGTRGAPIDIFQHGICPAGDCATGGARLPSGKHGPVWRPRACSECRYRVTGPRFLDGIVNRCNLLMWELRQSQQRGDRLARQVEEIEARTGKTAHALRRNQESQDFIREKLANELASEMITAQRALEIAKQAKNSAGKGSDLLVAATADFDPAYISVELNEMHEFELLHTIVAESYLLPATVLDLPDGTEAAYRSLIRKMMRANGLEESLLRLPEEREAETFLAAGGQILQAVSDPDKLQEIIDGTTSFDDAAEMHHIRSTLASIIETASAARQEPLGHE